MDLHTDESFRDGMGWDANYNIHTHIDSCLTPTLSLTNQTKPNQTKSNHVCGCHFCDGAKLFLFTFG